MNTTSNIRLLQNLILVATLCMTTGMAYAECTSIDLLYNHRYPYMYEEDGQIKGLTADPANRAFKQAGIAYSWQLIPSKRQMHYLRQNLACTCAVGWFKNAERESFALYTKSIYRDQPQVALTWAGNPKLDSPITTTELFAKKDLWVLKKSGYSYGRALDERLRSLQSKVDEVTWENETMLFSIYKKRHDYFLIAPEEAKALIKASDYPKERFRLIPLTDLDAAEKRYILCTPQVGRNIIRQLNQAIPDA